MLQPTNSDPFLPDLCRVGVVLAVILVTELLAIAYVLSLNSIAAFDWELLALLSLYTQWISLLSVLGLCHLRHFLNRQSDTVAGLLGFLWIVLVTLVANSCAQWIYLGASWLRWDASWLLRDLAIAAVLAGIGLRYMVVHQRWQNERRAMIAAKLDALSARIRPHFLFNSMNTIASLISYAPATAERAVEDLATLFRASLAQSNHLVNWRDEVEICEAYLRIEKQRLGDRLEVRWQLPDLPEELLLPPLSLQPLVENAVCHGIEQCQDGGTLAISAELDGDHVLFQVSNPLPNGENNSGSQHYDAGHNGMALANIRARLAAIYNDMYSATAELELQQDEQQFTAMFRVPLLLESGLAG